MTAKRKSFTDDLKNNPALTFLDTTEKIKETVPDSIRDERLKEYAEALLKAGYQFKQEPKKRRVQIVLQESLYSAAKEKIAGITDPETGKTLSFNEYINQLIRQDVYSNTQE